MRKNFFIINSLILVIFFLLYFFKITDLAALKLNDWFFQARYHFIDKNKPRASNDIVIIPLDDASYNKVKFRWPWPRGLMARIINNISRCQPKTICMDFVFPGETRVEDDTALAEAIKNARNIFIGSVVDSKGIPLNQLEQISQAALARGVVNKQISPDYFVRQARAAVLNQKENKYDFSLSVKAAAHFLGFAQEGISYQFSNIIFSDSARQINIPINQNNGNHLVNFRAQIEDYKVIPIWKAILGNFKEEEIKGKLILMGAETKILHDVYTTPLGLMSGLIVNANEIQNILRKDFMRTVPTTVNLTFTIIIFLIVTVLIFKLGVVSGLILTLLVILAFWAGGFNLFLRNYALDLFSLPFLCLSSFVVTNFSKYFLTLLENKRLQELAVTDGLTGLFLRRYFDLRLQSELERIERYGQQELSLLMLDIDHFKNINDTYGHQSGDAVLKIVAKTLKNVSRKVDIPARYGGEEFVIILPGTASGGAFACAEKIRSTIENTYIPEIKKNITLSIGIASIGRQHLPDNVTAEELIKAADDALYQAKESGRNKVVLANNQRQNET